MTAISPGETDRTTTAPLIGGFFALEPASATPSPIFPGADPRLARDSAGAAFGALVRLLDPPRIWLPGWLCSPFAYRLPANRLRLYRVTPDLAPDTTSLTALGPGDLLLAVDHFGRAPGPGWAAFVATNPETFFVEDCVQALDTGAAPWGDWRLYSPRKLMGLPEGGFLIPQTPRARAIALPPAAIPPDPARSAARRAPMALRRDHPGDNALWHPLHQQAEALADNADRAMDPAALALMAQLDPAPMIAARRANAARLARRLPDGARPLYDLTDPPFAPFGVPVLLPPARRDAILARLHAQGLFPAVHWRDILSPPDWAEDHARAASIVTLPCDHRYGPADMDRLAAALARALQEETP